MWKLFNPNPVGRRVGDCAVRAIAAALDVDWETAYDMICEAGRQMGDMPSSDSVWGAVLRQNGFLRAVLPNTCPDCYTVADFAAEHPDGVYVLGLDKHVVTLVDGDWLDTWNSGNEPVIFYWYERMNDT
jgi:hypothetical protein